MSLTYIGASDEMRPRSVLSVSCAPTRGAIHGTAPPHARIEGVCLSAIPRQRLCISDTTMFALADGKGNFSFKQRHRRGDLLGLRCRTRRGDVGPWLLIRLRRGAPPRKPCVALFRVGVELLPNDLVRLLNFNDIRPIGEPNAKLRIANRRTASIAAIRLNARGTFTPRTIVPGRPGDTLEVQGRYRSGWATIGKLKIPPRQTGPRMPRLAALTGGKRVTFLVRKATAPVFVGPPRPTQVFQGHIANCHFAAAASAVAHAQPRTFERLRVADDGNTYEFTFFHWNARGALQRVRVSATTELYHSASGDLLFGLGRRAGNRTAVQALWWPLVEKAYATWKGGYHAIGNGGTAHDALATLVGRRPRHRMLRADRQDEHWEELIALVDSRSPVVASTGSQTARYRNTGIMSSHSYAVLGYRGRAATRSVLLRNPWGEVQPTNARVRGVGIFELSWHEVVAHFEVLSFVG